MLLLSYSFSCSSITQFIKHKTLASSYIPYTQNLQ
jgi:hypothetical protein